MGLLTTNYWGRTNPFNISTISCWKFRGPYDSEQFIPAKLCCRYGTNVRAFANRNSVKKLRRQGKAQKDVTSQPNKRLSDEYDRHSDRSSSEDTDIQDNNEASSFSNLDAQTSVIIPSRRAVLQACTITSGLIGAFGLIIRQVSHVASTEGWPIVDSSTEISFSFEMWHLELITGLVILISSCRYLLLKTWPDFAESSEAANRQVLTSLRPLDYVVVSVLPGVSEELLFRGALLPLFGIGWKSVLVVAALFGILHLGSGRKYSFAVWATFVGLAYGYGTMLSSSIIVPMASHALNNLAGGIIWRYTSNSSK